MLDVIDTLNRSAMGSADVVADYRVQEAITAPERAALTRAASDLSGGAILDIGVGTGRTTPYLLALGGRYVGIDYSAAMLAECRRRFRGVEFLQLDARDLTPFHDGEFALVLFSCNGIGMVDHQGRLAILREVHRVLRPGGWFVMSAHNQHSPDHSAGMVLPEFELRRGVGATRVARDVARFAWHTVVRVRNYRHNSRFDRRTDDYSIINDRCHDYSVMLYYISLENQRRQLIDVGFCPDIPAYDLDGLPIPDGADCSDNSITYMATK